MLVGGGVFAALYGGFVVWKDSIRGKKLEISQIDEDPEEAKRTKVFLVTGANSGMIDILSKVEQCAFH